MKNKNLLLIHTRYSTSICSYTNCRSYEVPGTYLPARPDELEEAVERIVSVIAQALAGFDLDDDHRVHAARALRSAFHGFCHLEAGDGHPHPHELDDTFEGLIELLCAGIRSQAV